MWASGNPEPVGWQLTVTDTAITAAGWVGVGGTSLNGVRDFDFVSIATNGETALRYPLVNTLQPSVIGSVGATLQGDIQDTGGEDPTRYFEYGQTTAYGNIVSASVGAAGIFTAAIGGLTENTTYHYRAYATNSTGTGYGPDQTFTTTSYMRATQLQPNNTNISPLAINIFSWQKATQGIQTHDELRYRIVGDAAWITTGPIASTLLQHSFPANTFGIDKNYEWQIKSWDAANPNAYDCFNREDMSLSLV
ncbi:hypothetical protein SD71_15195 [Cohnella kolymensis]|uniref:Fibronectin type-III domain-containing protein n=1 Tax=Cohnella kolymensis TaxID=1590652 RepID=A0ABR5A3A4_9BACL|nr:hypothetical protein [Cohnella kolymensis]KIL35020.1 hypothetical protein SD71_15195 [Cohnella kolymensis]